MMIVLYEFRDLTSTMTGLFLSLTLGLNLVLNLHKLHYHNTLIFLTFYGFDQPLKFKVIGVTCTFIRSCGHHKGA